MWVKASNFITSKGQARIEILESHIQASSNRDKFKIIEARFFNITSCHNVIYLAKSPSQGQGDENTDAVVMPLNRWSDLCLRFRSEPGLTNCHRGLDNAGKTTIVKKIMGEDVNTVSPTLGFIIKTIDYDG